MVETQSFLPEAVFEASGHVQKFTDLMVKDEETGACYRADHLLRDKDLAICSEDAAELKHILAVLDDLSVEDVGAKIKEYGIVAPDTKNRLSDSYLFNLMFSISDSTGPSYMSPETAQGIFIGFKHLYKANRKELPFAAGQVAKVFRNEISSFLRFQTLSFLCSRQLNKRKASKKTFLEYAVTKGIINSQTLAYYIGRVYMFLTKLGINKDTLRFRQHLPNKIPHYTSDCRDAEIETSYGWIECVGISDEVDYEQLETKYILTFLFESCSVGNARKRGKKIQKEKSRCI